MQEAVCTLCTSFGSWTFFGLFPFKGTAYGAYGCIRMTVESGLSPTVRRHWGTSCPRKTKSAYGGAYGFSAMQPPIGPLLETAGGIAPTIRRRGVMESPRIPHIHLFPSASSPATCPREAPICRFSAPLAGFRPKRRWTGGHRRHRPSVAVYQARGASPARKRRSAVALPHSPGSPPTHKALVTLEKTSRLDRRKGQGTTCPQRICLQAMRR